MDQSDWNESQSPSDPESALESSHEGFVRALAVHERAIRAYVRGSLPRPEDVDEVMQNVLVVAWKKFSELDDVRQFPRWVCAIARYQILNFRRRMARDRLVLSEEILSLVADEGLEELELQAERITALNECIELLPKNHQALVMKAYHPDVAVAQLANEQGKSENAIYQLLWRIRQALAKCMDSKLTDLNM